MMVTLVTTWKLWRFRGTQVMVIIMTYICFICIPPPSVDDCSSLISSRQGGAAKRLQHAPGLVSHSAGGTRKLHLRHQHSGCKQSNHSQGWRRGWSSTTLRWSEKWRINSTSGTESKNNTTAEAEGEAAIFIQYQHASDDAYFHYIFCSVERYHSSDIT